MNVDVVTVPEVTEDERISLDRFARDWMKSALAKGEKNVVKLLRSLNEIDSTFSYRIFTDDHHRFTGFMFMTGKGECF